MKLSCYYFFLFTTRAIVKRLYKYMYKEDYLLRYYSVKDYEYELIAPNVLI